MITVAVSVSILLVLGTALAFGTVGAVIGSTKDMTLAGFFFGLLLGPIGLVIIAVLPPTQEQRDHVARRSGMKKCPSCGEFIRPEATVCRYCRRATAPVESPVDEDALDREWEKLNYS